jgi:ABC-type xylose transport system permease subunit
MFTKTDIEKYFSGEKQESLLFLFIGAAGVITAIILFFFIKTSYYKGMALPLALLGLLLGIVGFTVYKRSDADRIRNVYAYDMNPAELKEKELPRMKKVMKSFVLYRWMEIVFVLAGALLFYYFRNNTDKQFWAGLGLGLAIMGALALFADYFAEQRGHVYTKGIESFVN